MHRLGLIKSQNTLHKDYNIIKKNIAKGSASAFEQLFNAYHKELCYYAYKIIPDQEECKEVVQQVFIQLWEKRAQAEGIDSLKAYLYRSVHNVCLNKLKHEEVKKKYQSESRYLLQSMFWNEVGDSFNEELFGKVETAIEELPLKNKEVFNLRFIEGMNNAEVSDKLGITTRTVETHVSNALKFLRSQLGHLLVLIIFLKNF